MKYSILYRFICVALARSCVSEQILIAVPSAWSCKYAPSSSLGARYGQIPTPPSVDLEDNEKSKQQFSHFHDCFRLLSPVFVTVRHFSVRFANSKYHKLRLWHSHPLGMMKREQMCPLKMIIVWRHLVDHHFHRNY